MGKTVQKKTRIAAYCRVSSLSQEQLHSFDAQVNHYKTAFANDDSVVFVGIYSDAGISGTQAATREGFMRMMDDCRKGLIDCIWTKSVSRFGRNTVDTLIYTRELRSLGIDVFFEKENLHTMDAAGEMLLTLVAAFAESEMESHSENVKWGKRRRFERGIIETINISNMLGFHQDYNGVTIVEEEAAIVRRIYQEYLDGFNMKDIAAHLNADGVPTKKGGAKYTSTQISNILGNEKYAGNCLLQKHISIDPIAHRNIRNRGELDQYYIEDCYPAIIDKDAWLVVQEMMKQYGHNRLNSGEAHPFKGKMFCAVCDKPFHQSYTTAKDRTHICLYRCASCKDRSGVEVAGMTYVQPRMSTYQTDVSPAMQEYREKYGKKPEPRAYLCSDTRIDLDQPGKAFTRAWNWLISHKQRYLPILENNTESENLLIRYHSKVLLELIEEGPRLRDFGWDLFRKTIEKIVVNPSATLTFHFKAGIKITQ